MLRHIVHRLTTRRARPRAIYALACLALFLTGLASRHYDNPVSDLFGKYPGDMLWAMLAFFSLGLLFPRLSTGGIALLTAAISLLVEVLKLYHAPWMVALRASTFGYLVLGHIFSYQNLMVYALGIALSALIESLLLPAD